MPSRCRHQVSASHPHTPLLHLCSKPQALYNNAGYNYYGHSAGADGFYGAITAVIMLRTNLNFFARAVLSNMLHYYLLSSLFLWFSFVYDTSA
ncbi:hypothetical protein C8F04DRAFT_1125570 [Mycena alexandri]|uniref:Uncharacterized protein n=1 Tax=Mycena alexandri TaxID=1745969 RepID=A0AAD6WV55_9AGAR|nr:hypothetical protein C8F04DRAFT_1125570 [Mycena alexandri]